VATQVTFFFFVTLLYVLLWNLKKRKKQKEKNKENQNKETERRNTEIRG